MIRASDLNQPRAGCSHLCPARFVFIQPKLVSPSGDKSRHSSVNGASTQSLTINIMNPEQNNHGQSSTNFGPVIYCYTRAQAIADGVQVDVTQTAKEAGITFPVFLTRAVFDAYVAVPDGVTGQDETGRLFDICWMLRFAILRSRKEAGAACTRVPVALYVRNDNRRAKLVQLMAQCGPRDVDDPQPAITVML